MNEVLCCKNMAQGCQIKNNFQKIEKGGCFGKDLWQIIYFKAKLSRSIVPWEVLAELVF